MQIATRRHREDKKRKRTLGREEEDEEKKWTVRKATSDKWSKILSLWILFRWPWAFFFVNMSLSLSLATVCAQTSRVMETTLNLHFLYFFPLFRTVGWWSDFYAFILAFIVLVRWEWPRVKWTASGEKINDPLNHDRRHESMRCIEARMKIPLNSDYTTNGRRVFEETRDEMRVVERQKRGRSKWWRRRENLTPARHNKHTYTLWLMVNWKGRHEGVESDWTVCVCESRWTRRRRQEERRIHVCESESKAGVN